MDDIINAFKKVLDNYPSPKNVILQKLKLEFDLFFSKRDDIIIIEEGDKGQTIREITLKCKNVGLDYMEYTSQKRFYAFNVHFLIGLFITEKLSVSEAKAHLLEVKKVLTQKREAYSLDIPINEKYTYNKGFNQVSEAELSVLNFNLVRPNRKLWNDFQLKLLKAFLKNHKDIETDKAFAKMLRDTSVEDISKQNDKSDANGIIKKFHEYFTVGDKKEEFCNELKIAFVNKKGKYLKLLITTLKNRDLLEVEYGNFMKFYEAMSIFFEWDIGSYNSIQNYNVRIGEYSTDTITMKELDTKINTILSTINDN